MILFKSRDDVWSINRFSHVKMEKLQSSGVIHCFNVILYLYSKYQKYSDILVYNMVESHLLWSIILYNLDYMTTYMVN